jgi:hypothetical protein
MNYTELAEARGVDAANELLKSGWVLVKIIRTTSGPDGPYNLYVMGKPAV